MSKEKGPPPSYTAVASGDGYPTQQPYPTQPPYPGQPQGSYEQPPPYQGEPTKTGYSNPQDYNAQPGQPIIMQPQVVHVVPVVQNPPPNHMLFAVLSTLCCCWPIGIFAIMKSLEVNNALARGDREEAVRNSQHAYQLSKYAVIVGAIFTVIMMAVLIAYYVITFNYLYGRDD